MQIARLYCENPCVQRILEEILKYFGYVFWASEVIRLVLIRVMKRVSSGSSFNDECVCC